MPGINYQRSNTNTTNINNQNNCSPIKTKNTK